MKILMLTTKFPLDPESPYLTNDLCKALIDAGNTVTVVNIDWANDNPNVQHLEKENLFVYNIKKAEFKFLPATLRKPLIWSTSSLIAFIRTYKSLRENNYDVCILTTPLTIFSAFLALSRNIKKAKWIALCWDFFPIHQINLGLIPKNLYSKLHKVEEWVYANCFRIGVLSEDYKSFIQKNYKLGADSDIVITGLWGAHLSPQPFIEKLHESNKPLHSTIVYGGQLIEGRGLENFITLSRVANNISQKINILVIGNGNIQSSLKALCTKHGLNNITFMSNLTRTRYIGLIEKCMAGFISLDKNTHCPSFPSKIIDYLRAGLPVIAIDDLNPSIKSFIEDNQVGYYLSSNDETYLREVLSTLYKDNRTKQQISQNSLKCFNEKFTPNFVVNILLKNI